MGALQAVGGSQPKAARLLRIGGDTLRYRLNKHNLCAEPAFAVA
jgi:DNA-binding protein Fis